MRLALHRYRCSSFDAGIAIAIAIAIAIVVVGSGGVRELNLATLGVLCFAAAAVRASAAVVPAVAQPDAADDKNTEN